MTSRMGRQASPMLALLFLVACDPGGLVVERADRIVMQPHVGQLPAVCMSSCAMELASPHACVDPDSMFFVHAPQSSTVPFTPEEYAHYVRFIANHYPADLGRWFETAGRKTSAWMTGLQVIAMGGMPMNWQAILAWVLVVAFTIIFWSMIIT